MSLSISDILSVYPEKSSNSDGLIEAILKSFKKKDYKRSVLEIRPSALPLCGRRLSFDFVLDPSEKPVEPVDFINDAITGFGNTIHAIIQKWLGSIGLLLGDWVCLGCRVEAKWHKGAPLCKNKKCPDYKLPMVYQELNLNHPIVKLGHPDGLIVFDDTTFGLEIKTKSQKVLEEIREPVDQHIFYQAACYAAMLKFMKGIEVKEFIFFYIARNLPWRFKISYSPEKGKKAKVVFSHGKSVPHLLKIFKRKIDTRMVEEEFEYIKRYSKSQKKIGKKLLTLNDWGICKDVTDPNTRFCPYKHICFSRKYRD